MQRSRKGGWFERASGWVFYALFNALSHARIPRNLLTVRLMTRRYVASLVAQPDREVYLPGLLAVTGFRQEPLSVCKHSREASTYTLGRKVSMMVDAIASFSNRPLIIVLLDDLPHNQGRSILGVRVAGPLSTLAQADKGRAEAANLVAGTTVRRRLVRRRIEGYGAPFTPLIDPSVDMEGTRHGRDVVVFQNAVVAAEAVLGEGSVVSMGAVVGHECVLGMDCFVSPNAVLNGRVCLGDGVFVGANAAVLPDVRVGAWATVGACSLVVCDVPDGTTVVGVPARAFTARPDDLLINQELRNSGKEALNFLIS
ncbi:MAG: hypothetical protein A3F84_00840 [Candidatus Handelsmanbacteria bacterium RIFCSPLOWO2_12_FULL_64_10]|uniref:Acetyltransferase n=1 Tax=Handelsmanbacteria sp. (strain RIFCSPLOWO2_12_FULL_64_10) TaxID=1817868 RepID=A0A1F6C5F6_HANXR|nr:MAG: hypothetical protein A3F84_00840 [Candidatus Handelsmanbacteria bacterium RIFCSPLOWO2_12_FULL_64_10]